jgi:gluconokinase
MIIVVFGVSGSGKTTVGRALAERLGCEFADADDFHSAENVEKMRSGIPLDDDDRAGWLSDLRDLIDDRFAKGSDLVLACSALKQKYRDYLSENCEVRFVYLRGTFETISRRLIERPNHFMNPSLLRSQFDILEEPTDSRFTFDAEMTVERIVLEVLEERRRV